MSIISVLYIIILRYVRSYNSSYNNPFKSFVTLPPAPYNKESR